MATPIAASNSTSRITSQITFPPLAPGAIRIPISRVPPRHHVVHHAIEPDRGQQGRQASEDRRQHTLGRQ